MICIQHLEVRPGPNHTEAHNQRVPTMHIPSPLLCQTMQSHIISAYPPYAHPLSCQTIQSHNQRVPTLQLPIALLPPPSLFLVLLLPSLGPAPRVQPQHLSCFLPVCRPHWSLHELLPFSFRPVTIPTTNFLVGLIQLQAASHPKTYTQQGLPDIHRKSVTTCKTRTRHHLIQRGSR